MKNILSALLTSPVFPVIRSEGKPLTLNFDVLHFINAFPAESWQGEREAHTFIRVQGFEFRFWETRQGYVLDVVKTGTWEHLDAQSVLDNLDLQA